MKQTFTDRPSLLKACQRLRDGLFAGHDLAFDKVEGTLSLTLACPDNEGGGFRALLPRRPSWNLRVLHLTGIRKYKQSLTGGESDVYVFDRLEVERDGTEITLYFRPGDRAVLEVGAIQGTLTDSGRATSIPGRPSTENPLAAKAAKGRKP